MKKLILVLATLFITGLIGFTSCDRDNLSASDENDLLQQAEYETITEAVLQNIEDQIDKEISNLERLNYDLSSLKSAEITSCDPKITVETQLSSKFPKTITLDYGNGCTDAEGNTRAGKIVVHITGPYWEKNTVRTAKLVDYLFNDLKVAGERQETNKGTNKDGNYVFDVKHSLKITIAKSGELVSDRNWTRERIYNRGKDLTKTSDDEVWVTGTAKVEKKESTMMKEITKPLYRQLTCKYFMSGIITTYVDKVKTTELNYGDGKCDDKAIWTNFKTKETKEITLKSGINYFNIKK